MSDRDLIIALKKIYDYFLSDGVLTKNRVTSKNLLLEGKEIYLGNPRAGLSVVSHNTSMYFTKNSDFVFYPSYGFSYTDVIFIDSYEDIIIRCHEFEYFLGPLSEIEHMDDVQFRLAFSGILNLSIFNKELRESIYTIASILDDD